MQEKIRLVQLFHPTLGRKLALVEEPSLVLLTEPMSVYALALDAINAEQSIQTFIQQRLSDQKLDYNSVYEGESEWVLLPSFDHPNDPFGCLVSGTGLTHKNSALNRQMMHQAVAKTLTDSMRMYQWGLEGGQPEEGAIGVQPEWFYK